MMKLLCPLCSQNGREKWIEPKEVKELIVWECEVGEYLYGERTYTSHWKRSELRKK